MPCGNDRMPKQLQYVLAAGIGGYAGRIQANAVPTALEHIGLSEEHYIKGACWVAGFGINSILAVAGVYRLIDAGKEIFCEGGGFSCRKIGFTISCLVSFFISYATLMTNVAAADEDTSALFKDGWDFYARFGSILPGMLFLWSLIEQFMKLLASGGKNGYNSFSIKGMRLITVPLIFGLLIPSRLAFNGESISAFHNSEIWERVLFTPLACASAWVSGGFSTLGAWEFKKGDGLLAVVGQVVLFIVCLFSIASIVKPVYDLAEAWQFNDAQRGFFLFLSAAGVATGNFLSVNKLLAQVNAGDNQGYHSLNG